MNYVYIVYNCKQSFGNFLASAIYMGSLCEKYSTITWEICFDDIPDDLISEIVCQDASQSKLLNCIELISKSEPACYFLSSKYWNKTILTLTDSVRNKIINSLPLQKIENTMNTIHNEVLFMPLQETLYPQFAEKIKIYNLPTESIKIVNENSMETILMLRSATHIYQICSDAPQSAALSEACSALFQIPLTRLNLDHPPKKDNSCIVYTFTNIYGFYSSIFFMIGSYLYSKQLGVPFYIEMSGWQYTYRLGWHDYFATLQILPEEHCIIYKPSAVPAFTEMEIAQALKEIYHLHPHIVRSTIKYDVAIYVRRGDKFIESQFLSVPIIYEKVKHCIKDSAKIFIQSDDYRVIEEFRELVPDSCTIETRTNPSERGSYHNAEYLKLDKNNCEKTSICNIEKSPELIYEEMCEFLTAMDLCLNASICWTDPESNIGRFQKYMNPNVLFYR